MSIFDSRKKQSFKYDAGASNEVGGIQHFRELMAGAGENVFKVNSEGMFMGADNYTDAPFRVNFDGSFKATTGTFSGTLDAPSGTLGTITAGTITGATIQTAATGQRVRLTSANYIEFLNDNTVKGKVGATGSGNSLQIDTADDIYFTQNGVSRFKFTSSGNIDFAADNKYIHWAGGAEIEGRSDRIRTNYPIEINGDCFPDDNSTWDIGAGNRKWKYGYIDEIFCDEITVDDKFHGCGAISGCAYIEVNLLSEEQQEERKKNLKESNKRKKKSKKVVSEKDRQIENDELKKLKDVNFTGFAKGDVLCWGSKGLKKSDLDTANCVVAVAGDNGMPIVMGAEMIKVIGNVARNSLLVTSPKEGYARMWTDKNNEPPRGCVIGMALENKTNNDSSMIKAMIQKI